MDLFPLLRTHVCFACASVVCSTAVMARPAEDRSIGELSATITRGKTPVPGATVEVRAAADDRIIDRATTKGDGRFAFELPEGTYDLEVHPSSTGSRGRRAKDEDFTVAYRAALGVGVIAGETHELPAIDLERHQTAGGRVLHGTVRDPGGRAVPHALVAVWHQGIHFGEPGTPPRVHANEIGRYVVATWTRNTWLQAQAGEMKSVAKGALSPTLDLTVRPEEGTLKGVHPLDWTARYTVTSGPSGALTGTIVSDSAGPFEIALLRDEERANPPPVHAMAVFFVGDRCLDCVPARLPWERYNFGGNRFVFPHVPTGVIHVRVRQAERAAIASERIAPDTTKNLDVHIVGSSAVRATFLRPGGRPLVFARVCVQPPDFPDESLGCAESDAEGQLRIEQLTAGLRKLSIPHADGITVELRDDQVLDLGTVRLPSMDDEQER